MNDNLSNDLSKEKQIDKVKEIYDVMLMKTTRLYFKKYDLGEGFPDNYRINIAWDILENWFYVDAPVKYNKYK